MQHARTLNATCAALQRMAQQNTGNVQSDALHHYTQLVNARAQAIAHGSEATHVACDDAYFSAVDFLQRCK